MFSTDSRLFYLCAYDTSDIVFIRIFVDMFLYGIEKMSVPSHIVKTFEKLGRLSTFVQFQSELLTCVQQETGNSREFLQDFHKLETNLERVDFLYERLQKYNLLKDKFSEDGKSDRKANKHKNKGDNAFVKKLFVKALQHYTRCIMKAESQELLAVGYANRSATLFKLEMYDESLVDIERALSNNYPEHLRPSLQKRQQKLQTLVGTAKRAHVFHEPPPTIDDNNSSIPCASGHVEIKVDEKSRKRVFAAKDIQIGEVISVESPYSFTVAAADLYHCHDCFQLCYNPIPCDTCCQVVYCNETCRDNAKEKYHTHECPILISLKNIVGKHKAFILAMKITFLMDDENFAGGYEEVYKLVGNLSTKHIKDELFTIALVTALMYHLVKNHTKKFTENTDAEIENDFKKFLMINLRICLIHAAGIDELCPNITDESHQVGQELLQFKSDTVGCALYPFYSLFRHVCCPNVFAHHHGTKRVLRAIRTIKQGTECFVSYGPYYVEHGKEERQNRLFSQYHFTCECKACVKDWPQLDLKPYYLKTTEDLAIVSRIRDGNVEAATFGIEKFVRKVKQLELLEPLSDLTLYQKLLSYCYDILGNKRQIL